MPEAARFSDPIEHSNALAGLLTGLAVGALAGVAVLAIVTTGGLAAAAIGAIVVAASTGGMLGGIAGEWLGSSSKSKSGAIARPCSPDVLLNGLRAARVTDLAACTKHDAKPIVQGASTVLIDGLPAARVDDQTECGGTIGEGSANILIGGPQGTYGIIESEIPPWARWLEFAVGLPALVSGIVSLSRLGIQLFRGGVQFFRASKLVVDANRLNHIFGKPMHNLGPLLRAFQGNQVKAYQAIYKATQEVIRSRGVTGVFEETVIVAGEQIIVRGRIIDGILKIGTVFKP